MTTYASQRRASVERNGDHAVAWLADAICCWHRRLALADPTLVDPVGRDAISEQGATNGVGASVRECHVVRIVPARSALPTSATRAMLSLRIASATASTIRPPSEVRFEL